MRILLILAILFASSVASAQTAIVADMGGDTVLVIVITDDGEFLILPNSMIGRLNQPPPTANPYPAPSASLRTAIAPILSMNLERADATSIAKVYGDAAFDVEYNLQAVENLKHIREGDDLPAAIKMRTNDLKQSIITNGKTLGLKGKYAGLAEALDKALAILLGLDVRDTKASDAVGLRAVAWALWEAGK